MIRSLILASLLFTTALHAQTPMPAETRVGIAELQAVALRQPDAHKLTAEKSKASGVYPPNA